jgi:hypothetical protein
VFYSLPCARPQFAKVAEKMCFTLFSLEVIASEVFARRRQEAGERKPKKSERVKSKARESEPKNIFSPAYKLKMCNTHTLTRRNEKKKLLNFAWRSELASFELFLR